VHKDMSETVKLYFSTNKPWSIKHKLWNNASTDILCRCCWYV